MSQTTFIGIDLAWKSQRNPSGAAVLRGDRSGAELMARSEPLLSTELVLEFIRRHTTGRTVVAIDAPLVIKNQVGQRTCETLVGQRYGARDASCHTSNLRLYPDAASVALAVALEADGFVHVDRSVHDLPARSFAEVYPHAGLVALFDLPKTIKYKKGTLANKRAGLGSLRAHVGLLTDVDPALRRGPLLTALLTEELSAYSGRALKNYEDGIDSVFCAYLAFYLWRWGWERNEVFGDVSSGYILNPTLVRGGIGKPA